MLRNKYTDGLLWLALALGGMLRFIPAIRTGFPINDGGMILAMTRDLQSSGFILPPVTSYNFLDIPFAYPPLGMYVAAFLSRAFSIPELELLRWLPPLLSAAIIPVFYWLAYRILDSKPKAIIATLIYALMPGSSDWLIMGGGLTRSFGILFSLLAIGTVCSVLRGAGSKRTLGLAILFCALAILSHPEMGLQTAGVCFVFWVVYGRNITGVKNAALVASGTALLTAPWWLTVLHYHGWAPFWSAIHTGVHEILLASLFHAFFSLQGSLPILPVFGLIGIFVVLRKREFLLVLWAFFPFLVDPRNAPAILTFPLLMLVSEGLYFLNQELIQAFSRTFPNSKNPDRSLTVLASGTLGLILLYLFFTTWTSRSNVVAVSLNSADRETMEWVKESTPPESQFLLITNTGNVSPMADSYQEWFPVLAERRSQNTLQGREWLLGGEFFEYVQGLIALQDCTDVDCLNTWLEEGNVPVDFVLVRKQRTSHALIDSLRADQHYELIYETANAEIFAFRP